MLATFKNRGKSQVAFQFGVLLGNRSVVTVRQAHPPISRGEVLRRNQLILNHMQPDYVGALVVFKVAPHSVFDHFSKLCHGIRLCKYRIAQGFGFVAAFGRLLYVEDDFSGGLLAFHRLIICLTSLPLRGALQPRIVGELVESITGTINVTPSPHHKGR